MDLKDIKEAIVVWGAVKQETIKQIKEENSLFIIPEQRPSLLGKNYVVPLLKQNAINYVYCTDNTLGLLFYKNKIKKTLFYYKKCDNSGVMGRSGSLYIVLLSRLHGVPIVTLEGENENFNTEDVDASTLSGHDFLIDPDEKRFVVNPVEELITWQMLQ